MLTSIFAATPTVELVQHRWNLRCHPVGVPNVLIGKLIRIKNVGRVGASARNDP